MKTGTKFYRALAGRLRKVGRGGPLPVRYLDVLGRRETLRRRVRRLRRRIRRTNDLSLIGFRPPLSVAGASSRVVVEAEGLAAMGLPIALTLDGTGGHRGAAVGDVAEALGVETGRAYGDLDVLHLYRDLMGWHPALLRAHSSRRLARIPALLERLAAERESLEGRLREYVKQMDIRTFTCALETTSLAKALADWTRPDVLITFAKERGFRLGGGRDLRPVDTAWGGGRGAAVVATDDLRSLLGRPGDLVVLDCDTEGWDGWTDTVTVVIRTFQEYRIPEARRFGFYGMAEAADEPASSAG